MDIKGAKALKERLARHGAHEALPAPADVDVPQDAPPVYHWTGKTPAAPTSSETDDDNAQRRAALFGRLGLSSR